MVCQKCKVNQANIYYKQTVNGKTAALALCETCAAKSGIDFGENFIPGLFGSVFEALAGKAPYLAGQDEVKRCTLCASAFRDITQKGKVGCAKCYETFAPELEGTIEGIHGNVRHIGRKPENL